MSVLGHLQPASVFSWFEELCKIPHGSGNTAAISDFCVRFAKERGLRVHQDEVGNVIIYKPATPGYEAAPTVIIQGHLDMVAEKVPGCPLDMEKEPLHLRVDGDWVSAEGTTLGGDDGIAVAMALAVLDSSDLEHPALEAVFTIDEETGMEGAIALDGNLLEGRRLLNIDSEEEGILTVSCAGGADSLVDIGLDVEPCEWNAYRLVISGLVGGHSGAEIDKGRASAVVLLGRVLQELFDRVPMRVVSAVSGMKANAIPSHAEAVLALAEADFEKAQAVLSEMQSTLRAEYAVADPNITLTLTPEGKAAQALSEHSTRRVCAFLCLAPNGVAAMSMDIPGLVQTSDNLGIFRVENGRLTGTFSVRSSVATQKQMLLTRIRLLCEGLDGTATNTSSYPAWEYRRESPLRDVMVKVFAAQYGYEPKVEAIHAGLECGLLSGKLPGLDAVSFGPDLKDIHTPRERMSISSVARTWQYLTAGLRELRQ